MRVEFILFLHHIYPWRNTYQYKLLTTHPSDENQALWMLDQKACQHTRWANAAWMLGQRRRRWPNIETALSERLSFARRPSGLCPCFRSAQIPTNPLHPKGWSGLKSFVKILCVSMWWNKRLIVLFCSSSRMFIWYWDKEMLIHLRG